MKLLWLSPVLDPDLTLSAKAVSPAANRWQLSLINALEEAGASSKVLSFLPDPVWPRGKLRISSNNVWLPSHLNGSMNSYLNLPLIRSLSVAHSYRETIRFIANERTRYDAVVTYNDILGLSDAARYAKKLLDIPWTCIVADGVPPKGCDGYIYLSWHSYCTNTKASPRLHLDGGVELQNNSRISQKVTKATDKYVFMYSGTLGKYGGLDLLIDAFEKANLTDCELWITGKGGDRSLAQAAAGSNTSIKFFGLLTDYALRNLMAQADCFVNPRPSCLAGNEANFPSKILEYMAYMKPIVSTMTPGLHPSYSQILIIPEKETAGAIRDALFVAKGLDKRESQQISREIYSFSVKHTWSDQAKRFAQWINGDLNTFIH